MAEETGNHRSSRLGQIVLEGMEEIIGRSGVHAVLNTDLMARFYQQENEMGAQEEGLPARELSAIQSSLEEMYGKRGSRGVALRAGRASFKYVLRYYGASLGLTDLNYRLLPAPARLRTGLEALVKLFSDLEGGPVEVEQAETAWLWRSTACPFCWLRTTSEPACPFTVGLLQEFLSWNSGGKVYHVEETECRAQGKPACVFRIDIKPLE